MDQAIQDGIAQSWIRDTGVPLCDWDLGDDHGGVAAVAVVKDFKQVSGLRAGKRVPQPIIEDEELNAGQFVQEFGIGSVGVGQFKCVEQARGALVADCVFGFTGCPAKGDKMRILYVGTTAMQRMWRYLLVRGKKLSPSAPLFLGKFGDRMTPSSLRQMVKRAGRRADVEKAHPHRFRHTFAINFLRNGGSVLELKEMLGHEKLETVLIYARLAEVDLEMAQRRSNVADTWNL